MHESVTIRGRPFVLSTPESDAEFEAIVALDAAVHGEGAAALCRALDAGCPGMGRGDWYAVLDADGGRVLSTACLIPGQWTYRGAGASVRIGTAEVGIVATAEDARGLGLSSFVIRRVMDDARARGFHLAVIEGIPYFYRRFGFEYAIELSVQLRLGPGLSPWRAGLAAGPAAVAAGGSGMDDANPPRAGGFSLRLACPDDIPAIAAWYRQACAGLSVLSDRGPELWRHLFGAAQMGIDTAVTRYVIVGPDGRDAGWLGTQHDNFGAGLDLVEAGPPSLPTRTVLELADGLRMRAGKPYLTLDLPTTHPVSRAAMALGAVRRREYAWQVACPDAAALIAAIRPVAEARLGASGWKGRPYRMALGLYGRSVAMDWDGSSLSVGEAASGTNPDGGDDGPALPPELLAPLVLGYRGVAELRALRHDVFVYGDDQAFLDAAFPRVDSFVYLPY